MNPPRQQQLQEALARITAANKRAEHGSTHSERMDALLAMQEDIKTLRKLTSEREAELHGPI